MASNNNLRRAELYEKLSADLEEKGAAFLSGASSLFTFNTEPNCNGSKPDGSLIPVLRPADHPPRAVVLHLDSGCASHISQIIKKIFLPYFEGVIWFQNEFLYHASMFHASHHLISVPATKTEIAAETNSIKSVASSLCPLTISLDRVVLTSGGVLLACWQVISGTDPVMIRLKLKEALPHAPEKQLYDPAILHTSLARLSGHPNIPMKESNETISLLECAQGLVQLANHQLQGFQVMISKMWFVEEFDEFALALNGRMLIHEFPLGHHGL